jgi:3-methyl-2-oxobutanoate hydroxymethyltransferase
LIAQRKVAIVRFQMRSLVASNPEPTSYRVSLPALAEKKRHGEPIVMVTAYDHTSAEVAEAASVDLVLAGDTAAMTVLGYGDTTVPVTLDEMLVLTKAVRRGLRTPLLVGDLSFGSYERSHEQAIASAQRLVKEAGCDVVKFEGPAPTRARAIIDAGIPVMGHLGLTPQTKSALGGFKTQARDSEAARKLLRDALELQDAGCFALVLEAVPSEVASQVSRKLSIPTIGIGAGPGTDGQVLVYNDLLGIFDAFKPRFVKRYKHLRREMIEGVTSYAEEVRRQEFPGSEHGYAIDPAQLQAFLSEPDITGCSAHEKSETDGWR